MPKYRVLKQFQGDRLYRPEDGVVDLDGRNVAKLVDQRYLEPVVGAPEAPAQPEPPVEQPKIDSEPSAPPKRGRGRPRKVHTVEGLLEVLADR